MYDLLLWTSMLPHDRRLRATVLRCRRPTDPNSQDMDQYYWFLNDSAPLASIYGHPEAAREAAELEAANGSSRHPSGLHFLPLDSEEDSDMNVEQPEDMFDAAYGSVYHKPSLERNRARMSEEKKASTQFHGHPSTSRRIRLDSTEDQDDNERAMTSVQKQALVCLQFDMDSFDAHFVLSDTDRVRFKCSGVTVFFEAGHDGRPELNYGTLELVKLELLHSSHTDSSWKHRLVHLSWPSVGYPLNTSPGGTTASDLGQSGEPMFSLALKHCQTKYTDSVSGDLLYRDEFNCAWRLQDAAFVNDPDLQRDLTLLNVITGLLSVLESPTTETIKHLLPGYRPPDLLLIQHMHLERVCMIWSTQDVLGNHLNGVRGLCGCESVSVTLNTATSSQTDSSALPGTLIMVFLNNAALFLCPVYRKSLSESPHSSVTFSDWIGSLNLSECICVADLNHLELRFFSNPVPSVGTPPATNRIDVRLTNNLLRLNTCADSLVALQRLIESLTATDLSGPSSTGTANAVCGTPKKTSRYSSVHSSPCFPRGDLTTGSQMSSDSREDLLQGAIFDVDTCGSTPKHRASKQGSLHATIVNSSDDPNTDLTKHTSPEPRPCRTPQLCGPHGDARSPGSNTPTTSKNKTPVRSDITRPPPDDTSSPGSSPNEFVVIQSPMAHSRKPAKSSVVHFRCLNTEEQQFELREDHYAPPCTVTRSNRVSRTNRLFSDPPTIYPRADWAMTVHNFDIEWNLYGGSDLSAETDTPRLSTTMIHATSDTRLDTRHHDVAPPPLLKAAAQPNNKLLGRASPAVSDPGSGQRAAHRFRHDRPAMVPPAQQRQAATSPKSSGASDKVVTTLREVRFRGGKNRQTNKCVSTRVSGIYFRHACFPLHTREPSSALCFTGDPTNRYVLNIGSLTIVDQVAESKINQLLYGYKRTSSGSAVPHNDMNTPLFRLSVVCWRVPTHTTMPETSDSLDPSLDYSNELEAKISCQPLRINLDQHTLVFLEEFQELLTTCFLESESSGSPVPQSSFRSPPPESNDRTSPVVSAESKHSPSGSREGQTPTLPPEAFPVKPSPFFIRKVTFYPDLPIRFDYHGRQLNWTSGSLQNLIRMLLQLNNAEITLPRRVYQRGYPSLDRLLAEVVEDMRNVLKAQVPQLLATSIGPMHEVSQFLLGIWDLVYQPVYSLYHGSRTISTAQSDAWKAYWHGPDLDLSTYGPAMHPALIDPASAGSGFIHGLRCGTRSFSTSTLWATLQLSIQGVRAMQSIAETTYDLVTPGPALRSRQMRLRQPANLREGFGNAVNAMSRGFQMVTDDLFGATRAQSELELACNKGPVGVVGDVLRQIPPTIVAPIVTGCEVTANILGGFRNQLRPEAKEEDEQKWKDTKGL